MRLSTAIRLGAMLGPQIRGCYSDTVGTCALGAAALAVGARTDSHSAMSRVIQAEWPWMYTTFAMSPDGACRGPAVVGSIILHLNDDAKWTREQIAGWVATVEPQDTQAVLEMSESTSVQARRP